MKIRVLILFCYALNLTNFYGQIVADSIEGNFPLVNNTNVEVVRTSTETTFEDIKKQSSWNFYDSTYTVNLKTAIWLKFEFENRSKDSIQTYLASNAHYTYIHQQKNDKFETFKNGFYVPLSKRANQIEDNFTQLSLAPFQKSLVYIRLQANWPVKDLSFPCIVSELEYYKESSQIIKTQTNSIGLIYFYIISLSTIFMFALIFWLRLREKLFFHYLGYLFFQLIYGFIVLRKSSASTGSIFEHFPKLAFDLNEPTQFMFIGFYVLFVLHLLTIKKYDRLLAKVLTYLGIGCFIYAIFYFILSHFFYEPMLISNISKIIRLLIFPINLVLIFWIIYKAKHPLLPYFIVGQFFFFVGAVLASYFGFFGMTNIPDSMFGVIQDPNIIFQIGLLLEVYCFSLAIGKNIFLLRKEKEKTDTELIAQLQKNKRFQEKMNRDLDQKVNEKTGELIQLYSKLEKEREQKIKDDFMQRIKETEMIALRSQMNPHFIFNSLSAIKHLMMTARNEDAIVYLDDFSSLLRGILQNSDRKKITVEEELDFLELYLSLERNRMGPDLNYSIQVSSREALSQYQIPPLLLQPIVENAIWHGLHPSMKAEKKLKVIFDTTENLKIIIEDNGIGRKESGKKKKLHSAMGTTLIKDRLTLYNHLSDQAIFLKITDLEEDGNILGTRITLTYQY